MQSNAARALFALVSLAAIVALFVVLSDGDGDDAGPAVDEAGERAATTQEHDATGSETPEPEQNRQRPEPPTIRLIGGEPAGGVERLEHSRGDRVRFRVISDTPEELHVHGYDVVAGLEPGEPRTVQFDAEIDGVFEVELHGSGVQIARLQVNP